MKILNPKSHPLVTVVGCQHGNEYLGLSILEALQNRPHIASRIQFVLANEPAIKRNCRFIDQDLNRSFPGRHNGNREESLAHDLLPIVQSSRFILDLHTTTSDIKMTPIVTNLNRNTCRILNLCNSKEIAYVETPLAAKSLIRHCQAGVSLEYNADYAKTPEAIEDVFRIVRGLLDQRSITPSLRRIFHITATVDPSLRLPTEMKNFMYSDEIYGYPFLIGEQSYPNGLYASRISEVII